MNDTLKNILRKDETVLWAGAPEPVEVLEKPHVPLLIVRWAVCAVLGVLLIAYLTYFSVYVFQVENQARIVVGVVLAACIFVALRPFMDARGPAQTGLLRRHRPALYPLSPQRRRL